MVWTSALLAVAILAAYWPVTHYGFINYDDDEYVTQNPQVCSGLTWRGFGWALTTGCASNWHPLTWVSHMTDVQLFGLKAGMHHTTSVLWHTANAVLLLVALRRATGSFGRSVVVAGLFALHPLRVQSVAWVSERKDVLSGFFFMLTILGYLAYVSAAKETLSSGETGSGPKHIFTRSKYFYVLALIAFALGLMSKPMLVTLPFVLLLLDFWPLGRFRRERVIPQGAASDSSAGGAFKLLIEKIPFLGLSVLSSVVTFFVQRNSGAMPAMGYISLTARIENAFVAYMRYIARTIWPEKLAAFYPHVDWPFAQVASALTAVALLTAVAVVLRRKAPYLFSGWFWFIGMLVPVIGLVQVGEQSMADRYSYLPSIGLFIALIWSVCEAASWVTRSMSLGDWVGRYALPALAAVCLVICAGWTNWQVRYWRDSETLFMRALEVSPQDNAIAKFSLANALTEEGRMDEGVKYLREIIQSDPGFAEVHARLAFILAGKGQLSEALEHYNTALALRPNLSGALNNLAWMRATASDPKYRDGLEAVKLALRACEMTHYEKTVFIGTLAAAYAEAGRFDDAIATAQRAREHALAWNEQALARKNLELLDLYQQHKAYREPSANP